MKVTGRLARARTHTHKSRVGGSGVPGGKVVGEVFSFEKLRI